MRSGGRLWKRLAVLAACVMIPLAACDPNDVPAGDGLSPANAGASCWGIKQAHPASGDGTYWLYTPELDRPTQFHCDMTTDGGGWVLIGRGREGWHFRNAGQGTAAAIRNNPTGTAAFSPATLPSSTITDLLGGQSVSSLVDGIRVDRATNANGTSFQNMRLFPAYSDWSWALPQGLRLNSIRIGTTNYANGNTKDTYSSFWDYPNSGLRGQQGLNRLWTEAISQNNWLQGFGYGTGISGTTSSSTYLYRATSQGFVLPFTRVWIRPRIENTKPPAVPKEGFAAEAMPAGLRNVHEPASWGVVGVDHAGEGSIEPWNTTVNTLKVYGDRAFVGGRFTHVKQGATGPSHAQRSLAAFDLDGNWISSFDPVIAGRVWDMTMTDDGKLIIGGDFTSVDGLPDTSGLAALDPLTGEVITSWKANIRHTSQSHIVRGLDHRDGVIYATGRFNRVHGGTWNEITVSSAIDLSASDGQPGTWKPILSGTAVRVRAAAAGDRVYLVGYFDNVNGDTNHGYFAITNAADGTPVSGIGPWYPSGGSSAKYQQAVAEYGSEVIVGGSEHNTQWYTRDRTAMIDSHITRRGGDTQAIEVLGNWIYVGCHCDDTLFAGTNNWSSPAGFRSVHPINTVARFDPVTREIDDSWFPHGIKGDVGDGIWAIDQDSRGCVWVGGDVVRGAATGNPTIDWIGGFARYCPTDSTPPSTPSNLQGSAGTDSVSVSWGGSTDNVGVTGYDVYRNNRVIATVGGTSFTDTAPIAGSRYTVRSFDAAGNRSASPTPLKIAGPVPPDEYLLPFGSEWSWRNEEPAPPTGWQLPEFDDSAWPVGPGQLGFGDTPKSTIISSTGPPRPLTSYYRRVVTIDDPSSLKDVRLDLIRNSGAVVYVNGVEVARSNMPAGPVGHGTYAAGPVPAAERHVPVSYTVARSFFQPGPNTIAVELHLDSRNQATAGFDLAVLATH